jgi:glutathione S-transferase
MNSKLLDIASSTVATFLRAGAGHRTVAHSQAPVIALQLYEFEACPHCRKVREALSALDLDVTIYPCSKGSRHRATVEKLGGKMQFPFLVDPAHQVKMYESKHIVRYLAKTYGDGRAPWQHRLGPLNDATSFAASMLRRRHGFRARGNKAPAEPLELWSYEASPYCRLVREALSELELPYTLHNVARGSQHREAFAAMSGKMRVPYLKDSNTKTAMFESRDIIRYLNETYGH